MKELPKCGDKVKIGKRVCVVVSKQGNDFIGKDDQGQLVGFDKHSPFTILERNLDREKAVASKDIVEVTKEVIPLAEGETNKAGDSPSASSSEGDVEEKSKMSFLDLLFSAKKK